MDLSTLINQSILENRHEQSRGYIGASQIGSDCQRAIWYTYKGYDKLVFNPRTKINYEIGKNLERFFMGCLAECGLNIECAEEKNDYLFVQDKAIPIFQGHLDGILTMPNGEKCVVEFKTCKNTSFIKFKKLGLRKWSIPYYSQIQSYMGMSGISMGVLLAINKDTSELHHEYISFNSAFYEGLCLRAETLSHADEAPERINKNPCFYLCSTCPYKKVCHD